jgi:small-conductance mechanosensitive channel
MDTTQFERWLFDPTIGKIVAAILGILVIQVLSRFLKSALAGRIRDTGTRYQVRKFITFAGYLGVVVFITLVFSDRLSSLTVALGVAGAGIAFALQEVIASIAGWFAISFANFYRVGDRVQLGGIKGDVIDVAILRTTLMEIGEWVKGDQYSGRIVRIANSFVFKEPVFNYSGDFPYLWDEIAVPIKYGSDHRLARQILQGVVEEVVGETSQRARQKWQAMVKKYLVEEASVDPVILLALNDNWMEYTVRYVVEYKARRGTKDRLFTRLLDEFAKTDGQVAIASTTIQLVELPPLEVRMEPGNGTGMPTRRMRSG